MYLRGGKGRYWDAKGLEYTGKRFAPGTAIFTEDFFNTPTRKRPMSPREKEEKKTQKLQQDEYMRKLSVAKRRPRTANPASARFSKNREHQPKAKGQVKPLVFRGAYFAHRIGGSKFEGKVSHTNKWH